MHVAIIMDGNGRWAAARGLPRTAGHREGARAARRTIEAAARAGISMLTLYAFSSDNWSRPRSETHHLMGLLRHHLVSERQSCIENGIRLRVIGRRDRLDDNLICAIEETEELTAAGRRMDLRIAIDYSSRYSIAASARNAASRPWNTSTFRASLARDTRVDPDSLDVDLLIRTGGERRLSDFLLWECAYAEIEFVDTCWPDFDGDALNEILHEFDRRERRFGGLPAMCARTAG
jgi:undecaprenyl diphosphate synthase